MDHFSTMLGYLNQITSVESGGGVYKIHNWNAHPAHIDNQLHKHSFFEVCYVVGGSAVYLDDDREFRLKSGDLFCSRPNVLHRIYEGRSLYLLWVSFEIDESESAPESVESARRLEQTERFLVRDAERLPAVLAWQSILEQAGEMHGIEEIMKPLASGFVAALIGSFRNAPFTSNKYAVGGDPRRILQQAKTFILDNLSMPLRLGDVADYLHVSERQLSRLFHDYDEQSFIRFVQSERIRKASDQLKRTDKTIKEIASDCGFDSVHYFTRVFTGMAGIPPGHYRAK